MVQLFVDIYEIASYKLLWDHLLKACVPTGKKVILRTGIADIEEINSYPGRAEIVITHGKSIMRLFFR